MKQLAIIILDWNGASDTIECLECLKDYSLYDIYLLDNGSNSENVQRVLNYLNPQIEIGECRVFKTLEFDGPVKPVNYILSERNLGFAVGNNAVASSISKKYDYILCLNNDTIVPENAIQHMLETCKKYNYTAITCEIMRFYEKEKLWNAGGCFTFLGERKYYSPKYINKKKKEGQLCISADFITGCALLIDTKYVKNNYLFTDLFFHGEEDYNLCYRLKKENYKVGVDLGVKIYHKVGRTIKKTNDYSKEINRMIVHYSNRVIDYKLFYSHIKWLLWREMYLFLLMLWELLEGYSFRDIKKMIGLIKDISNKNDDVKKPVFDSIMSFKWKKDR